MLNLKYPLVGAIAIAEKHHGAKAMEASIEDDSFKPVYEVKVTKNNQIFDVQIDGENGQVLGAREDLDD